jgi:hypothetical protein
MARKTVRVSPRRDGQNFQGSWYVKVSGRQKSNHTTKQAGKNAARGYASDGDEMVIHRTDGTIQERFTVQDATPYDDDKREQPDMFGMGTFNTALGFDE